MEMLREGLAPRVKNRGDADRPAEVPRITPESEERVRGSPEEERVEDAGIALGERMEGVRQREDDMEVRNRQEVGLSRGEPPLLREGLITVTLPSTLRALAFSHQALVYGALMRSAAAALQVLAADPRYVGAQVGCIAVLHTWTRALLYHPHVHLIVTAGGLSADRTQWIAPKHPAFLVPVLALSVIVRAKMCAALKHAGLLGQVPPTVWTTPWVVHAQPAGDGARVLDYLARYLFRVAITNSRLEQIDDDHVTFRYRDHRTQAIRRATLSGVEFLQRFLQHILPRRCMKVRYDGLWSARRRADLDHARDLLPAVPAAAAPTTPPATPTPTAAASLAPQPVCPRGVARAPCA